MDSIVAMWGLLCNECIVYVAAHKNDIDDLRQKAIEAWSTKTGKLTPSGIDCDGCLVGKRICKFCSTCKVGKCGLEKVLQTAVTVVSILVRNWRSFGKHSEVFP